MPRQWCDVLFRAVCATPTDEFPFWEIGASVLITGVVTWLTIWASIHASRRETGRALMASLRAESRARAEREREAERLAEEEALRQRIVLAAALSRGVHLMQTVRELPDGDRARVEAAAEWSALRVSFSVSAAPYAADLYEYADLRIDHALTAGSPPGGTPRVETFIEFALRTVFAENISDAASYWAKHATLEDGVARELADLRLAREERRRANDSELVRMIKKYRDSPQPEEGDIFSEDPGKPSTSDGPSAED